jgi:hypothetical protein
MYSNPSVFFLRKLVAALAMLAFVLAPVASAEPAGEPVAVVACDAGSGPVGAEGGADDHAGHDHHAHGCGSCHVHLIEPASPWPFLPAVRRADVHPLRVAGVPAPLPGELFRPPRA